MGARRPTVSSHSVLLPAAFCAAAVAAQHRTSATTGVRAILPPPSPRSSVRSAGWLRACPGSCENTGSCSSGGWATWTPRTAPGVPTSRYWSRTCWEATARATSRVWRPRWVQLPLPGAGGSSSMECRAAIGQANGQAAASIIVCCPPVVWSPPQGSHPRLSPHCLCTHRGADPGPAA